MEPMKNSDLPASFAAAMNPNYLGSPTVVERILGEFLSEMVEWLRDRSTGTLSAEKMVEMVTARGIDFAAIFSGENKEYIPVVGWNSNTGGLKSRLMADLGSYWRSHRTARGDDPFRVMYDWILWATFQAMKIGDDEILTPMKMAENIRQVTRLLTGTDKRVAA